MEHRILEISNLPSDATTEDIFKHFGQFGPIVQIRRGNAPHTLGKAYCVYKEVSDAVKARRELSGKPFHHRFLTMKPYQVPRTVKPEL